MSSFRPRSPSSYTSVFLSTFGDAFLLLGADQIVVGRLTQVPQVLRNTSTRPVSSTVVQPRNGDIFEVVIGLQELEHFDVALIEVMRMYCPLKTNGRVAAAMPARRALQSEAIRAVVCRARGWTGIVATTAHHGKGSNLRYSLVPVLARLDQRSECSAPSLAARHLWTVKGLVVNCRPLLSREGAVVLGSDLLGLRAFSPRKSLDASP